MTLRQRFIEALIAVMPDGYPCELSKREEALVSAIQASLNALEDKLNRDRDQE